MAITSRVMSIAALLFFPHAILSQAQVPAPDNAQRGIGKHAESITPVGAGHRYVIAIGINQYAHWHPLKTAVNDATEMAETLHKKFGYEILPSITDKSATKQRIDDLVTDELRTKLKPDDDLIVYFAGHGTTRTDTVGDDVLKTGFLVPVEARAGAEEHWGDYVKVDEFLRNVGDLPARHIVVILDSCHSGLALGSSFHTGRGGAAFEAAMAAKVSRKVITSTLADESAADEGDIKGHSLFTGLLIKGLDTGSADTAHRGFVTGSQLGVYVQDQVAAADGSRQRPEFGSFYHDGEGELVLRSPNETAASPLAASAGKFYALLIGIDKYQRFPLSNQVHDAESLAKEFQDDYGFSVVLLRDGEATHTSILEAVQRFKDVAGATDNLLIFFGGHSYVERASGRSYWLPYDAETPDSPNRISFDEIIDRVRVQSARHILVISSPALMNGTSRDVDGIAPTRGQEVFMARMQAWRSRTVMVSSGDSDVMSPDTGPNGHSIFAEALLEGLKSADGPAFTAGDLFFRSIRQSVMSNSSAIPMYTAVPNAGSENGDFVFLRKVP